jgi:hypothetical protein
VDERNETVLLVAENGAALCGENAVVRARGKKLPSDTEIAIEVASGTGDGPRIDGLILDVKYIAVEWRRSKREASGGGVKAVLMA